MSLRDIKGQDNALRMLMGAARRGRLAASYLFAGEEGIGKRLTAVNLAKALNCAAPRVSDGLSDACDGCPSCRKTDKGAHPDFLLIEPENGLIKVENIRRLEEALSFKAFEGGMKVVVVDDADAMNLSAANAFLKTLEEPPPGSLIVLVSSRPSGLPATIRSRCSRINFKPLSPEACEAVIGRARGDAASLARLSMGRPGLAVREDLLKERERFLDSLGRMLSLGEKPPWADRQGMERWLDLALLMLRDAAVLKVTGSTDGLINAEIAGKVRAMGGRADLKVIIECYGKLRRLRGALGLNLNKGITWNYTSAVMGELNAND